MVSKEGKILLKNTLKSQELKNRLKEENEMWLKWKNHKELSEKQLNEKQKFKSKVNEKRFEEKEKKITKNNKWLKKLLKEEKKHSNER
jgi:hypothetical protein